MTTISEWPSLVWLLGGLAIGIVFMLVRGWWRSRPSAKEPDRSAHSGLDTVLAWQPERVRILTRAERKILDALVQALPEYTVLAKMPVARFVRVPKRNSFNEWLNRVGYLSADFVVCDKGTDVIAVVQLRSERPSERSERRQTRMKRVLAASGVRFVSWGAGDPPSATTIRDRVLPGEDSPTQPGGADSVLPSQAALPDEQKMPLPEIDELADDDDARRREPPSSTWYTDIDSVSPRRDDHNRV